MAENCERQKSTRWVDAKVPTYGNDWGVDFSDEDGDERDHSELPVTPQTQDSSKTEEAPQHKKPYILKLPEISSPDEHASKVLNSPVAALATTTFNQSKNLATAVEFVNSNSSKPPEEVIGDTTTHETSPFQAPSLGQFSERFNTSQSDVSYASDTNSIQQEPQELNLGSSRNADLTKNIPEALAASVPEPLVLSIDRMQLESHDDLSSDVQSPPTSPLKLSNAISPTNKENLQREPDTKAIPEQDSLPMQKEDTITNVCHRVPKEGLESLIDDLLRLEKLSLVLMDADNSESSKKQLDSSIKSTSPAGDESAICTHDSPATLLQKHHSYLSDLRNRKASIRKEPPLVASPIHTSIKDDSNILNLGSEPRGDEKNDDAESDTEVALEHIESNSSVSTGSPSYIADVPSISSDAKVSRKDLTVSSKRFSLGSWKPNTSVFRERFVDNNDLEPHMNVSMYNEGESGYFKFTGVMRRVSGYAESFANSSCISVPDTIEANLHSVNEVNSDGYDPSLDVVSLVTVRQTQSGAPGPGASTPSLLRENTYKKGKFQEKISADNLVNEKTVATDNHTLEAVPAPTSAAKYPVFNWKNIMSVSQSVDRIMLLKQARADEEAYDTGLLNWLNEVLRSTDPSSSNMQIGLLATQAYKNAPHNDLRRHISLRSKVSMVRDKMDLGASFGRRFLSKGKKLMKPGSD